MGLLTVLGLKSRIALRSGGAAPPPSVSGEPDSRLGGPPRTKSVKPVETPGYQEPSWARPSPTLATEPVHVASIFFKTKEVALDSQDEAVLAQLAAAYAPYAKRNLGVRGAPQGLSGRVVGHADPRRSVEPNNQELSVARAVQVARRLARLLAAASHLNEGDFDLKTEGAGIAQQDEDEGAARLEANALATLRRADIYLNGQAVDTAAGPPAAPDEPDPAKEPPPLVKWDTDDGWVRFDDAIANAEKSEIKVMALQMLTHLQTGTGAAAPDDPVANAEAVMQIAVPRGRRSEFPGKIGYVEPPWWKSRAPDIGRSQGRNAARNTLIAKAKLLQHDYVETMRYGDTYVTAPGANADLLIEEVRKDDPDPAKVKEYVRPLAYFRFMLDATHDLAKEVFDLSK